MSLRKFDRSIGRNNPYKGFFKENFFEDSLMGESDFLPAANIRNLDDKYEIHLALPGYKKESIELSVDDNTLTVEAEEVKESEVTEGYTRKEFFQSSFERSFSLPQDVDEDKISAKFTDGVLIVSIGRHDHDPKVRRRKIDIK